MSSTLLLEQRLDQLRKEYKNNPERMGTIYLQAQVLKLGLRWKQQPIQGSFLGLVKKELFDEE